MVKVSVTKGDILDVWEEERKKSPTKKLSCHAVCKEVLSTLDLVADYVKSRDWGNALKSAAKKLEKLVQEYITAKKGPKRKQVDRSEVH